MKVINGIALLFVGLTPFIWLTCFTESYFSLNPLIDTIVPPGFTEAKFARIKIGMPKDEVLKILPPPTSSTSTYCYIFRPDKKHNCWYYGNDGAALLGDFAWINFEIAFDKEGKVIKTNHYVNAD
jgi:hypothetical protein